MRKEDIGQGNTYNQQRQRALVEINHSKLCSNITCSVVIRLNKRVRGMRQSDMSVLIEHNKYSAGEKEIIYINCSFARGLNMLPQAY